MGSVAAANPGVANLMQSLSVFNSSVLSSPKVESALEEAPSSDIVQLSMAATEMENVDALFGISNGSSGSSSTNIYSILANLEASQTGSGAPAATASGTAPAATQADQLATYQTALQAEVTQGLFGSGSSGGLAGSLLNVTG